MAKSSRGVRTVIEEEENNNLWADEDDGGAVTDNGEIEHHDDPDGNKFGMLPVAVMKDRRLTNGDKLAYAALASFANDEGRAFPSIGKIALRMGGKDSRNVRKHVVKLKQCGHVIIEILGGQKDGSRWANTYLLPALKRGGFV